MTREVGTRTVRLAADLAAKIRVICCHGEKRGHVRLTSQCYLDGLVRAAVERDYARVSAELVRRGPGPAVSLGESD